MDLTEPAAESGAAPSSLDVAIDAAVAEGLQVVDGLAEKVLAVLDRSLKAAEDAGSDHGDRAGHEILSAYAALLRERKTEAEARFGRQRSRLETFNLVLFGRTGAGKSSLIEALSSGDGTPISQGESDWTTDVRDVRWRASRLVDTPGIGGWGRTMARAELERRAEAAVADADVVILCFDTQSQQEGEFTRIAEWVSRYGKPVVAVLNSRNGRWRHPLKVGSQSSRRHLSQTVHEHVGHIRDELGVVGLTDVPVVAIHSKRAAIARTSDPYGGPDAEGRRKQRDEYGAGRLLAWSNLPQLEHLLAEALAQHAAPLRLGMLHEQARGLLVDVDAGVRSAHDEAVRLAEGLERGITEVLALVGRPADKALAKQVKRLEKLRGGFGVAEPSELLRHSRLRLAAGLQSARLAALRRADRLVDDAFDTGEDLSAEEFEREVLVPARTEAEVVGRAVGADLKRYVLQRLELVADDLRADLSAAIDGFEGASTAAGKLSRTVGLVLQTGSGLIGMGSGGFFLAAALINSWNPAGWVLGLVAVGSFVSGIASSYFGGRFRRKAATDRIRALSDVRSRARRSVSDTFDRLEEVISADFSRILAQAAHERLADDIARAMALRRVSRAAAAASRDLQKAVTRLPAGADASGLLSEVAKDLQRRRHPGEPTAERLVWLGESWCTDPEGLVEAEETPASTTVSRGPVQHDRLLARVRSVVDAVGAIPEQGRGAAWLADTADRLVDDREALDALASLASLAEGGPARIVVAGDYSTGKSSFIKRILVDAGLTPPPGLEVSAQPKTSSAEAFRWDDWEIVDTPGFQSPHPDHCAIARDAVVGASLVIVLFNPNLVVGAGADLAAVLVGDRAAGRVGKLPRTLFIINRSDELGIDPEEDPAGYENLCRRKELELAQALGAVHGHVVGGPAEVGVERILCVASDPYGLVGDRVEVDRADYDRFREWDGMEPLGQGLREAARSLVPNGADVRLLEGGVAGLGDLITARRELVGSLTSAIDQQRRLLLDLDACLGAGRALQLAARDRLVSSLVWFVAQLFDDVGDASHDRDELAARVERLEGWAGDAEVQQLYREWAAQFGRELEEWQEATSARIEARLGSAAFMSVFPDGGPSLDVAHLRPRDTSVVREATAGGSKFANYAAKVPRETVTRVAHMFDVKFKPWGATKLTSKINTAGGVLGVAFGAVEVYTTWHSTKVEGESERTAREQRGIALRQVREEAERFFDSTEADSPGATMAASLAYVQQARDDVEGQLADARTEAAALRRMIDLCEQPVQLALDRLET